MAFVREPVLEPVPIAQLRPTQMTVGLREVEERREHWRARKPGDDNAYFAKHMIPVVLGPKNRHYVVDHHHLACALMAEGVTEIFVVTLARLHKLDQDAFWVVLDNRGWMHPFDEKGRRRPYEDIPRSIDKLVDDPYRSLAGALRRSGGFAKDTTPFSEFLWADFLRRRIGRQDVKRDFDAAFRKALALAKKKEADYLPGWCGATDQG